jgi:APA family basic amino acid/polyamine antiporter
VWAELGAAMPGSGGSYQYLKEIYGPKSLGRLISFLFIWQLSFSAPLSIASGCIGLAGYAAYLWPGLEHQFLSHTANAQIPLVGNLQVSWVVTLGTAVALGACLLAVFLLYRRITAIGRLSQVLWVVVMGTIGWIIFAGLTHFNKALVFDFPPGALTLSRGFFSGLGSAMLIATYDYWGYYNVCFLGDEVKEPARNIPRALLLSILMVACLYIVMNVSILAVVPWREMTGRGSDLYVVSLFMQKIYGHWAATLVTGLVMWTAFASVFSLMLGYSRVPYAAALDGNYFRAMAKVHPKHRFPYVSLLSLGGVAAIFCFFRLADVIAALVVIRIMLQFLVQAIGVIVLRVRRPEMPRPFRMWFYPLPALVASIGFGYILFVRVNALKEIRYALVILILGIAIYMVRAWRQHEWPFGLGTANVPEGSL